MEGLGVRLLGGRYIGCPQRLSLVGLADLHDRGGGGHFYATMGGDPARSGQDDIAPGGDEAIQRRGGIAAERPQIGQHDELVFFQQTLGIHLGDEIGADDVEGNVLFLEGAVQPAEFLDAVVIARICGPQAIGPGQSNAAARLQRAVHRLVVAEEARNLACQRQIGVGNAAWGAHDIGGRIAATGDGLQQVLRKELGLLARHAIGHVHERDRVHHQRDLGQAGPVGADIFAGGMVPELAPEGIVGLIVDNRGAAAHRAAAPGYGPISWSPGSG